MYSHLAFLGQSTNNVYSQKLVKQWTNIDDIKTTEDLAIDTEVKECSPDLVAVPCYSSTLSLQLRLREGDDIFVRTYKSDLLIDDRKATYFGLLYVSE